MGELKKMSAEGTITSDIIRNALFSAANDINKKFETMPRTFGQVMTSFKNNALFAFQPLFDRFSEFLNSEGFANFSDAVVKGMYLMADTANIVIDGFTRIYDVVQNNWDLFQPILLIALPVALAMLVCLDIFCNRGIMGATCAALLRGGGLGNY